ncbi:MAG TPA: acetylglutamate kinase [Acidimicrobiales bacterium]|jgi:acetylglutamate kinase|nr:acetylglutamate kinase [Acidimicrobiales bacterium]
MSSPTQRAEVLVEALPYIRRFRGQTVVVKFGGNAMTDAALARQFAEDVVLMHSVGIHIVVVHGGGPQIGELLGRLGIVSEFRDGLRVTDAVTLDVARMVLEGKVSSEIVSAINIHGPYAIGLSGADAGLIRAHARNPELGFVGDVTSVNPHIIERLLAEEFIPVISTIGSDERGQAYNINADTVATAVAQTMKAEKLVYLTDVDGLLADVDDPKSLITRVSAGELRGMIASRALTGGMIPKAQACIDAVEGGVRSVHMVNGTVAHVLLLELFTDEGIGTMITGDAT